MPLRVNKRIWGELLLYLSLISFTEGMTAGAENPLPPNSSPPLFTVPYPEHIPANDVFSLPYLQEESFFDSDRLFGLFVSTGYTFSDFISPVTNPVFFEDPRTLTEVRPIFLHHNIPNSLGGGDVDLIAVQARAALTERLSIIATKDGFIMSDGNLLNDGWADVSAGLKYQLYADECCGRLLSTGVSFELPVGSSRALQGNGDGEFHLFASMGTRFWTSSHWISSSGFRLPTDRSDESSVWYWSNHIDHEIIAGIYTFSEYSWYHWMSSGKNGIPGVEGGDLFNLGSMEVGGNDIVTAAWGLKYKPHEQMEIGIAYEWPMTNRQDLLENRLTTDLILRY